MAADLEEKKKELIDHLVSAGFLRSRAVIEAFRKVPREKFVPAALRSHAYENEPLPIGEGQTISQPLTVAVMTEALGARRGHKILEVGAGSGYQAAILSEVAGKKGRIITIERIPSLVKMAKENLESARCTNVEVVEGDGSRGYEKEAPFDRIIVTASAPEIPQPLIEQLKEGGRLVIPVGDELLLIEKAKKGIVKKMLGYYAFVPLVGEHGHQISHAHPGETV